VVFLRDIDGGVEIAVKVVPGASRDRIAGSLADALKIQVAAPPEKGKANKAVEALLAKALKTRTGNVTVVGGLTTARKVVRINGTTADVVRALLGLGED
jgi:hypothetical protein